MALIGAEHSVDPAPRRRGACRAWSARTSASAPPPRASATEPAAAG